VNVDLIFGTPGETMASWRRTLEEAVALEPDHLSCYALTVEPGTPLGRRVAAGLFPEPDPDAQADMFQTAIRFLGARSYTHYEVSNWCRPGFECRHNLGYWRREAYLGLGAGAHSYRDGRRWWNVRPPAAYIESADAGRLPVGGEERLGRAEARLEEVFLALRTNEGVPEEDIPAATAAPYLSQGVLRSRAGRLVLTDSGMFLANDVALALLG
jgi:oxygen-independent coproporphyrinogen-3 oxidase